MRGVGNLVFRRRRRQRSARGRCGSLLLHRNWTCITYSLPVSRRTRRVRRRATGRRCRHLSCNSWPAQGSIGPDPKAHRPSVAGRRSEFGRDRSLKSQLADAQIAACEFDRALALLRDAKQALALAVSPAPAEPETVLSPIAGLQLRVGAFDSALETVDAIGELTALRRRRRAHPRSPL